MDEATEPATAAIEFAAQWVAAGYHFDFGMRSLQREVDRFLETQLPEISAIDQRRKAQAGLGAYVGEALARLYGGTWGGEFCGTNSGMNFYQSYVAFGEFKFFPSHYVAYRIANGLSEGTFAAYLSNVLPHMQHTQP